MFSIDLTDKIIYGDADTQTIEVKSFHQISPSNNNLETQAPVLRIISLPETKSPPSSFIDVHVFDGQLRNFSPKRNYSSDEIVSRLNAFKNELTDPQAINTINLILQDMGKGGLYSNNQVKDNMSADILLMDILERNYKDVFEYLQEQLADTTQLGTCNSGRVNRLLQIWGALFDNEMN